MREKKIGKYPTEETKRKMKRNHKGFSGKTHSEETKKKMSNSKKGIRCYNFGKNLSDDTKKKLSCSIKLHWEKKKGIISEEEYLILKRNFK